MVQKRDNATIRMLGSAAAQCSGKKTADATIATGKCAVTSVILVTDGTNDASLVMHDSVDNSGTIIREFRVDGESDFGGNAINFPVFMAEGIYANVTGTGAFYFIDFVDLDE